jgi:nucleoside-triphosphatase THEP1
MEVKLTKKIVFVVGQRGVGKSTLVQEAIRGFKKYQIHYGFLAPEKFCRGFNCVVFEEVSVADLTIAAVSDAEKYAVRYGTTLVYVVQGSLGDLPSGVVGNENIQIINLNKDYASKTA